MNDFFEDDLIHSLFVPPPPPQMYYIRYRHPSKPSEEDSLNDQQAKENSLARSTSKDTSKDTSKETTGSIEANPEEGESESKTRTETTSTKEENCKELSVNLIGQNQISNLRTIFKFRLNYLSGQFMRFTSFSRCLAGFYDHHTISTRDQDQSRHLNII
jgi:hypothetical protein